MVYLKRCLVVTRLVPRETAAILAHAHLAPPPPAPPPHLFSRPHSLTLCLYSSLPPLLPPSPPPPHPRPPLTLSPPPQPPNPCLSVCRFLGQLPCTNQSLRLTRHGGEQQEDEAVMKVYEDCKRSSTDQIRQKYSQSFPDMRVDRVVFVASAADELPERLMTCVLRAARPSHDKDVRRG